MIISRYNSLCTSVVIAAFLTEKLEMLLGTAKSKGNVTESLGITIVIVHYNS